MNIRQFQHHLSVARIAVALIREHTPIDDEFRELKLDPAGFRSRIGEAFEDIDELCDAIDRVMRPQPTNPVTYPTGARK